MGMKADQEISLDFEGLLSYLRSKTRVFMDVDGHEYYVTHTDGYWRVQDCERLNDKGRFVDCSELVTTLPELVELPWLDGKSVHDLTDCATFYESIQEGWVTPDGVGPVAAEAAEAEEATEVAAAEE
ncbi:MAG: CDP-alcohol phosphatidyltransferase [Collinsella sp.]|uniref:CDP-alcohol phosphatidyltransferase n=1 Tax=Collinsella sp. TaxID=1965294 RepID=UPI002E783537|nr:CDP-alcohol phosphatidyltransferase [Collinsella sp.]MEE0703814.1 CDP-alcohol phosphatidyltransferase [Collinsella sp.]